MSSDPYRDAVVPPERWERPTVYIGESEAPRQDLAATFATLLDAVLKEPEVSDRDAWIAATADVMSRIAIERLTR